MLLLMTFEHSVNVAWYIISDISDIDISISESIDTKNESSKSNYSLSSS